jgi:hypothetical protein
LFRRTNCHFASVAQCQQKGESTDPLLAVEAKRKPKNLASVAGTPKRILFRSSAWRWRYCSKRPFDKGNRLRMSVVL